MEEHFLIDIEGYVWSIRCSNHYVSTIRRHPNRHIMHIQENNVNSSYTFSRMANQVTMARHANRQGRPLFWVQLRNDIYDHSGITSNTHLHLQICRYHRQSSSDFEVHCHPTHRSHSVHLQSHPPCPLVPVSLVQLWPVSLANI